jgi:hypothetical protein
MGTEDKAKTPGNLQIVELTLVVDTADDENISLETLIEDLMREIRCGCFCYELLEAKQVKKITYANGLKDVMSNGDTH